MSAKLDLKIWGVRGGSPTWNEKAQCVMHIEREFSKLSNSYISADAFSGSGDTYKRREQCEIEICQNEKILFSGSFDQLCQKLQTVTTVPTVQPNLDVILNFIKYYTAGRSDAEASKLYSAAIDYIAKDYVDGKPSQTVPNVPIVPPLKSSK